MMLSRESVARGLRERGRAKTLLFLEHCIGVSERGRAQTVLPEHCVCHIWRHRCSAERKKHMLQCQRLSGNESRKQDLCFCHDMMEKQALAVWNGAFREGLGVGAAELG